MGSPHYEGAHQLPSEEEANGESTQGEAEEEHQGKHCQTDRHCCRSSRP